MTRAHAVGAVAKLAAMTLAESFCKSLANEWILILVAIYLHLSLTMFTAIVPFQRDGTR